MSILAITTTRFYTRTSFGGAVVGRAVTMAVLLTAVGTSALASGTEASAEACGKAFRNGVPVLWRKHSDAELKFLNRGYVPTEAEYADGVYSYDLIAIRPGNGQTMARATCKADETGHVIAIRIESKFSNDGRH